MSMWHEERLYIDGELVEAEGGKVYDNINPATGEVIGVAADASGDDLRRAIAAARRAFDETDWSTNVELRVRCLRQLHEAIVEHHDEFIEITIAEVGAPRMLIGGPQLDSPVGYLTYYADMAESYEWTTELGVGRDHGRARQPLGRARGRRRRRRHHPVELPEPDQPGQDRPGPRRRLHRRAEAGPRHAVDRPGPRPPRRRAHRHPRRRVQRRHLVGQGHRRDPHHLARRRHGQLHRLHRHGPADHGGRRRHHQAGLPRAGRQVGPHRARRRRRHGLAPSAAPPSAAAPTAARAAPPAPASCSPAPATRRASRPPPRSWACSPTATPTTPAT